MWGDISQYVCTILFLQWLYNKHMTEPLLIQYNQKASIMEYMELNALGDIQITELTGY